MKRWPSSVAAFVKAEFLLVAAVAVIAACVLGFIGLADELADGDAHAFDMAVLQMLHPDAANPSDAIGPEWLDRASADITALGGVAVLLVLALGASGFLLMAHRRIEAGTVALAFVGAVTLSEMLKAVFGRDRPPEIYRAAETINASFPSGHALMSAAVFLSLGAMLARAAKRGVIRVYIIAMALGLTLLVGATRIHLGVHWTTDVLAGWAAGAAWAAVCWLGGDLLARRAGGAET